MADGVHPSIKRRAEHNAVINTFVALADKEIEATDVIDAAHRTGEEPSYAGGEMTAHGFRSMASTLLSDQRLRPDLIELQCAYGE
jgi:hypothetical protein